MYNKYLFLLAHQVYDKNFYSICKSLSISQWKNYDELKKEQELKLRKIISFAYNNVPFYHRKFKEMDIDVSSIKNIEDLEKLPIISKDIIRENWNDFKAVNINHIKCYQNSTGGSTGTPLRYMLSKNDRILSAAILYRGWSYGGYNFGDKIFTLSGSSLEVETKSYVLTKANEIARNIRNLSVFDMDLKTTYKYIETINRFKPKFFRAYPSSIYYLSDFIEENGIEVHKPLAVFTTSEKLHPYMRSKIEDVFSCEVYDNYGLNDGGVTAYECSEHNGLHVDSERSILEIVNESGDQIQSGVGEILATSLHNYAMPLIRYDTGDMANLIEDSCSCGRGSKLLKEIFGRSTDLLKTPEGAIVHGWFFLYLFWEYCQGIKEYQVVQEKIDKITIKIVKGNDFDYGQLNKIKEIIHSKSKQWEVEIKFVSKIDRTKAGKFKFIVNELKQ